MKSIEEIEIPEEMTVTLYVCLNLNTEKSYDFGRVECSTFPFHKWAQEESVSGCDSYKGWVLLAEKEVTFPVPNNNNIDIRSLALESLEEEKKSILARHYKEEKEIEDKISRFLAIEHKPEEEDGAKYFSECTPLQRNDTEYEYPL